MKKIIPFILVASLTSNIQAQDDLLKTLESNQTIVNEPVIATFKTLKIINAQTNETVHKRVLDFRVAHRFGNIGAESGGGYHNLYGFDNSSDIRIAFEYGVTDRLQVGASRSKYDENLEGLIKYRLLQQTTNDKIPVSITLFGSMSYTPKKDDLGEFDKTDENGNVETINARRIKYASQVIVARKFSNAVSVLVSPTYIHRNYVSDPNDENGIFALGIGARIKVSRSMSIIADYFHTFNDYRKNDANPKFYDPLGIGVEFETGGHVFSLMFTNSPALIETTFLDTHDSWSKGGVKFGFNISRNFNL
ncbi:MAG: hypothetical protein JNK61_05785 [Bacteroidia bacterium]|nr:hypothetical protein [Bacteroidia bacterium]